MARQNGRDLRIKNTSGNVVSVVNTKTININNTPVDVTGDDDSGFITLLDRPGTKQITFDCSGFTTNDTFRDQALAGTSLLEAYTIEYLSTDGLGTVIYSISGNFFLATYTETGASDGGIEFTANLQSSGAFAKVTA